MPEKDSTSAWINDSQSVEHMGPSHNPQPNLPLQVSTLVFWGELPIIP